MMDTLMTIICVIVMLPLLPSLLKTRSGGNISGFKSRNDYQVGKIKKRI